MLSYRHGFHAGNHADVLKHWLLVDLLLALHKKVAPFFVLDTHAGAGVYDLSDVQALKLREFETGIARLWQISAPPALEAYLSAVAQCNDGSATLRRYPGSPWLIHHFLRSQDRAVCMELHGNEAGNLQQQMTGAGRLQLREGDGFTAVSALIPPLEKRGLIFIDPSYEVDSDWADVETAIRLAAHRFRQGVIAVWFPLLSDRRATRFLERVQRLGVPKTWVAELRVGQLPGMCGSGMIIVNPPWGLTDRVANDLPALAACLAQDASAASRCEWLVPE